MERLKPRRASRARLNIEMVLVCREAIPAIGALPGDELVVRLDHPDFPIVLRRAFQAQVVTQIPTEAVSLLYAEPAVDDSDARGLLHRAAARHAGWPRLEP